MRFSAIVSGAALAASVLASPIDNYIVHEKRHAAPTGWEAIGEVKRDGVLPMRIAIKQRNIDQGYSHIMDVSDPESPNFGKHWTPKQVAEMFAPSDESITAVREWLQAAGISDERTKLSQGSNWLTFKATVGEAESLLKTKYYAYEHAVSGAPHIACEDYSIPKHLSDHIDFVTPTLHFDVKPEAPKGDRLSKRQTPVSDVNTKDIGNPGTIPGAGSLPKFGGWIKPWNIISQLKNCDTQITPDCLRALYEFLPNNHANPANSYGVVEYTPQAYLPSDLDMFFANFSKAQVGDRPIFDSVDGGVLQTAMEGFDYNGESDLDLEYAMTLVYPQKVTLYQVGDLEEGASFNNFLDAIDASYCTYEGGDNPSQDATYPDPLPGGYKGAEACGTFAPTKVISTSYSYNEHDLTPAYEMRQCNEYMKLGLMGTTILYSSGDYGVAGNGGQCINPDGSYNNGGSGRFNPSFPGTCPYITSVGATQVKPGTNIVAALATGTEPEQACETVIYSGGGFSNVFPMPSYQSAAVKEFFANHNPPYGADRYNNSMMTRGFPDVSANGANYVVAVDGNFSMVYGTSASSPTFGSIVTLINQARLDVGKKSVGFMNPTLYAHPNVLNDITTGGNQGCGTPGFMATTGWDPVTGLGTPNYPKLLALYLLLP